VLKKLEIGMEKIKITTSNINEKVREIDNMNKVLQLQNEITKYQIEVQYYGKEFKSESLINILEPGRTHVHSNYMNVYFNEKISENLLTYLLSDCIMIVKPHENYEEMGYQFIEIINLKPVNYYSIPCCFEYKHDKRFFQLNIYQKSVVFQTLGIKIYFNLIIEIGKQYFEWGNERIEWMNLINNVIKKNNSLNITEKAESSFILLKEKFFLEKNNNENKNDTNEKNNENNIN
jgi:hypothetical protein